MSGAGSDQGSFFDNPLPDPATNKLNPPRRNASATQLEAHRLALPKAAGTKMTYLTYVASRWPDGATDWEVTDATGMLRTTVQPTRNALIKDGWIEGSLVVRMEKTHRPATVWRLTQKGHEEWQRRNLNVREG